MSARGIPKELRKQATAAQQTKLTCCYCGKKLLKSVHFHYGPHPVDENGYAQGPAQIASYTVMPYTNGYDGRWCSLLCARAFANSALKAGYRIKDQRKAHALRFAHSARAQGDKA